MVASFAESPWACVSLDHVIPLTRGRYCFSAWFWRSAPASCSVDLYAGDEPVQVEAIVELRRPEVAKMLEASGRSAAGLTPFLAIAKSPPDGGHGAIRLRQEGIDAELTATQPVAGRSAATALVEAVGAISKGWDHPLLAELLVEGPPEAALAYLRKLQENSAHPAARRFGERLIDRIPRSAPAWRDAYSRLLATVLRLLEASGPTAIDDELRSSASWLHELGLEAELTLDDAATLILILFRTQMLASAAQVVRRVFDVSATEAAIRAASLIPILPQDCRGWLGELLREAGRNPGPAAAALNALGGSLAASSRFDEAEMMFAASAAIDRSSSIASLNAGWLRHAAGDVPGAERCFANVGRAYPAATSSVLWPTLGGARWPAKPVEIADVSGPPAGGWPRITLITPSFNQAQFVEETVLSVLNQGYPNLQYIVIDGGSSDGAREILEQYRDRIDVLIIEPDNGQTEAINKGLALADGDLIGWLNSDDMLAPGALHVMARRWLATGADLLAGLSLVHADGRLVLVNRPAAGPEGFNPQALAGIFEHWLKGDFFYQPEVLFSRQALERAGGRLDPSLYYAMDYDLWMRMAQAGCRLALVDWPIAFFRQHEGQKTAQFVDSLEEQARVRQARHALSPPAERVQAISARRRGFDAKRRPAVAVVTGRRDWMFSGDLEAELRRRLGDDYEVSLVRGAEDLGPRKIDAALVIARATTRSEEIERLRDAGAERLVAGWFWDSHHHPFQNYAVSTALDLVVPGHAAFSEYLRSPSSLLLDPLPLCVTQWSSARVEALFPRVGRGPREASLYGGFVRHPFARERNAFLAACMGRFAGGALSLLEEGNLRPYFGLGEDERFAQWCRYKTSLVVPLHNDLSQRFFDALLAGQIPLVPEELAAFDELIAPELQKELPVFKFSTKSLESLERAQQAALAAFDRDGLEGVRRRHEHALRNHMFEHRIAALLSLAREVAA